MTALYKRGTWKILDISIKLNINVTNNCKIKSLMDFSLYSLSAAAGGMRVEKLREMAWSHTTSDYYVGNELALRWVVMQCTY